MSSPRISLRDALLKAEGSLDTVIAGAITKAKRLVVDQGGTSEEVEAILAHYRLQLAEWKKQELGKLEADLRSWILSPPELPEPRPPGTPLH